MVGGDWWVGGEWWVVSRVVGGESSGGWWVVSGETSYALVTRWKMLLARRRDSADPWIGLGLG